METDAAGFFVSALDLADLNVDDLQGKVVVYNWPDLDWLVGHVTRRPPDRKERDGDGNLVTWWVRFEGEDFETGCALHSDGYSCTTTASMLKRAS
eukprot:1867237-Prymnesium_polylepis.1